MTLFFVFRHPSTDKVMWTDDRTTADNAAKLGWELLCTSPVKIGQMDPADFAREANPVVGWGVFEDTVAGKPFIGAWTERDNREGCIDQGNFYPTVDEAERGLAAKYPTNVG